MSHVSIRPGDSLTVAEDIIIQFDKFDIFGGCSHLSIYDAYHELAVVRGPEPESAEEEVQVRLRELAKEIISGLSTLDTIQRKTLLDSFVSELFLSVAKQEFHEARRQRQAEGIAAAKARGARLGRSLRPLPDNFDECHRKWRDGEIKMREAAEACGMPKSSFRDAVMRKEQSADCAV